MEHTDTQNDTQIHKLTLSFIVFTIRNTRYKFHNFYPITISLLHGGLQLLVDDVIHQYRIAELKI